MSKNSALATLQLKADGILREINQQIGEASCSTDEQCRTLPVGHRACGGPAAYLAYSIDKIDEDKLIELSKEHTATHREINRLKELMSTCEMLMPPPIACINNRCVIQLHQSK